MLELNEDVVVLDREIIEVHLPDVLEVDDEVLERLDVRRVVRLEVRDEMEGV